MINGKHLAITAHITTYASPKGAVISDHPHKWNHKRLHGAIGNIPPAEFEARYSRQNAASEAA